jgi:hypothetical protein
MVPTFQFFVVNSCVEKIKCTLLENFSYGFYRGLRSLREWADQPIAWLAP